MLPDASSTKICRPRGLVRGAKNLPRLIALKLLPPNGADASASPPCAKEWQPSAEPPPKLLYFPHQHRCIELPDFGRRSYCHHALRERSS
jgi:hypothetical protein